MSKVECPICERRFRHLYLYIRHVRGKSREENALVKIDTSKDNPHSRVYKKIIEKCDKKVKDYIQMFK